MRTNKFNILIRLLIFSALSLGLTACGGGGGGGGDTAAVTPTDCVLGVSKIGDCTL